MICVKNRPSVINEKDRVVKFMYTDCKKKPFLRYRIAKVVVLSSNEKKKIILYYKFNWHILIFLVSCTYDCKLPYMVLVFFGNHENVFVRRRIFS